MASLVDVQVRLCRHFDTIFESCRLVSVVVPEDASGVFSSALKNLNATTEPESAVGSKAVALKHVYEFEESAVAVLTS